MKYEYRLSNACNNNHSINETIQMKFNKLYTIVNANKSIEVEVQINQFLIKYPHAIEYVFQCIWSLPNNSTNIM